MQGLVRQGPAASNKVHQTNNRTQKEKLMLVCDRHWLHRDALAADREGLRGAHRSGGRSGSSPAAVRYWFTRACTSAFDSPGGSRLWPLLARRW